MMATSQRSYAWPDGKEKMVCVLEPWRPSRPEFVFSDTDSVDDVYKRPCGLMDKALVFGTKDCRFESCQGQVRKLCSNWRSVVLVKQPLNTCVASVSSRLQPSVAQRAW